MSDNKHIDSFDRNGIRRLMADYEGIRYESRPLQLFMTEILETIERNLGLEHDSSLLDIGCGKGYFLKFMRDNGYRNVSGIEPNELMRKEKVFNRITTGSFEKNGCQDSSFDVVFTCHTLHHLQDPLPIYAIREMLRITSRYIVIVEINNTNIPVFVRSIIKWRSEINAWRYNRGRVAKILECFDVSTLYAADLASCYISGGSVFHRVLKLIGNPPYNIFIVEKHA